MINARPAAARLSSNGVVDLMSGSKLGHHGKWVTAKLAMRLPESLAGETLRVDVRRHATAVEHAGSVADAGDDPQGWGCRAAHPPRGSPMLT